MIGFIAFIFTLGLGFTVGHLAAEELEEALYESHPAPIVVRFGVACGLPAITLMGLAVGGPKLAWVGLKNHLSVVLYGRVSK